MSCLESPAAGSTSATSETEPDAPLEEPMASESKYESAAASSDHDLATDSDESTTSESEYYTYSDSGSDPDSDSDSESGQTPISSPVSSPGKPFLNESPTSSAHISPVDSTTSPIDDDPVPSPQSPKTGPNFFALLGSRHPYRTALGHPHIRPENSDLPRLGRPPGPRAALQKAKAQEAVLRAWEEAEAERQRAWMRKVMGRDEFEW